MVPGKSLGTNGKLPKLKDPKHTIRRTWFSLNWGINACPQVNAPKL